MVNRERERRCEEFKGKLESIRYTNECDQRKIKEIEARWKMKEVLTKTKGQ